MLTDPNDPYVETRGAGDMVDIYVRDSRIPLERIVLRWKRGDTPEDIHEDFPSVSLASIYGTIAYYLSHQEDMDRFLAEHQEFYKAQRARVEAADPEWYAWMRAKMAEIYARKGDLQDAGQEGDVQPSKAEPSRAP